MKKLIKVLTVLEVIAGVILLAGSIAGMVFFLQGVDVFAGLAELVNDFFSLGGTGSELVAADFVFILFCSLAALITLSIATLIAHVRVSHKKVRAPRAPKMPKAKKVKRVKEKRVKEIKRVEEKKVVEAPVVKTEVKTTTQTTTAAQVPARSFIDKLKRK